MASKYVPPSLRSPIKREEEPTPKPIVVVVEPSAQIQATKYVPPNKRETNPMITGFIGTISAACTPSSFPSLASAASSPSAMAPKMNYLQKIRDAELAREEEDTVSNEALERDGWRIMNMSLGYLKANVEGWYERVFYEEQTLPF